MSEHTPVVLIVDDEKIVLDGVRDQLRRSAAGAYLVEPADDAHEALELLDELKADGAALAVVVADHLMPGMCGAELLAEVHRRDPKILCVLLTGQADAEAVGLAVNEARLYRYLAKPWQESDLVLTVREAVRRYQSERELERQQRELRRLNGELSDTVTELDALRVRLEQEVVYLRSELRSEHGFEEILGDSASLTQALERVAKVARSDASVLILGESGTGKELVARAIHRRSDRAGKALVKVNCAALPTNLVESELFGHEKGAFTGALARRIGRFELADGGTLFLDEIGELPLELQAKLLRVLQEGELERLGDSRTHTVDVRVVAATHRNLADDVAAGRFREDLYYRLSVFPVVLPPLRERRADIPVLAQHFATCYSARMGRTIEAISKRALERLASYHWPGTVRELQNVIERAVILSDGPCLEIDEALELLPLEGSAATTRHTAAAPRTLRELEREAIEQALQVCGGVVGGQKGAARMLDVPASTLRERIRRHVISLPPRN